MTRSIFEPNTQSDLSSLAYRVRQLERRPGFVPANAQYEIKVFADENSPGSSTATSVVTVGDGKFIFAIPDDLNGLDLVDADAFISTASSSGLVTVQIRNITTASDILSTLITIDVGEFTSFTAATQPVIIGANATVQTADLIAIDVDGAGTGARGLGVILEYQ